MCLFDCWVLTAVLSFHLMTVIPVWGMQPVKAPTNPRKPARWLDGPPVNCRTIQPSIKLMCFLGFLQVLVKIIYQCHHKGSHHFLMYSLGIIQYYRSAEFHFLWGRTSTRVLILISSEDTSPDSISSDHMAKLCFCCGWFCPNHVRMVKVWRSSKPSTEA